MTLLENHKINSAFDILFKDAFGGMTNDYVPALNNKIHYPIDIYENDEGMKLEIACVGLEKKDIDININGDVICISSETKQKQGRGFGTQKQGFSYDGIPIAWG